MAAYSATIQKQLQLNWPETGDIFSWIDSVDEVSIGSFSRLVRFMLCLKQSCIRKRICMYCSRDEQVEVQASDSPQ